MQSKNQTSQERRETLKRQMGEVACLPICDEARRDVEEKIVAAGAWAEREWLDLLQEDEALRLELRRVSTPLGLRERLLRIPADAAAKTPRSTIRRIAPWFLMAAAAAIIVLLASTDWFREPNPSSASPMPKRIDPVTQFAIVAMDHHARNLTLRETEKITTEKLFTQSLAAAVPFAVALPEVLKAQDYRLLGGHICTKCRPPVVLSLWQGKDRRYPLLQFDPAKLGMGANEIRPPVCVPGMQKSTGLCDVLIWSENGRGYAFAVRHGQTLPLPSSVVATIAALPSISPLRVLPASAFLAWDIQQ